MTRHSLLTAAFLCGICAASCTARGSAAILPRHDTAESISFARSAAINLTDLQSAVAQPQEEGISVTSDGAGLIRISTSGTKEPLLLAISGSLTGTLEITTRKDADLALELNDVTITSGSAPAITVDKAARTFIVLNGESTLSDGRVYGTDYSKTGSRAKATLYSKGALLISGCGSLTINEGYKHGIYSGDYIHVSGGAITVNNGGQTCIRSANGFSMSSGALTLSGTAGHAEHPNDNSRGIVVEGKEGAGGAGKGYVRISGGTVDITCTGKAISAKWDIAEDARTPDTSDDPNPLVLIEGGTISVTTTDAVIDPERNPRKITYKNADGKTVTETEKCIPEGIEGKNGVIISGGTLRVRATDDAVNASRAGGGLIHISGGSMYLHSSSADALDSNGDILISGGTIVAVAPTGSEDCFDCDGTLTFTGGHAAGVSGSPRIYATNQNKASTQKALVLGAQCAGTSGTVVLRDSEGTAALAFTIPQEISRYASVTLSAPSLRAGTYTLLSNCTVSGGAEFHGLYTEMPDVHGGTQSGTLRVTPGENVYLLGAQEGFGPPPQRFGPPPPFHAPR